jgi:hypothetical protein
MDTKLKILIVSRFFYPENTPRAFRTTELARYFHKLGHEVVVYVPNVASRGNTFKQQFEFEIRDLGTLVWKEPKLSPPLLMMKRIRKRMLNLFFQYPDIELMFKVPKALKGVNGFDLLISVAMPHSIHWGISKVWNERKPMAKVWVADCGDPFMGQENDTFKAPFYFSLLEKSWCRKANFITVPVEGAIQAYYPEFHDKIRVIPQGFDFNALKMGRESVNNSIPVFGYAGVFIPGMRDPKEFVQYIQTLDQPFEFHVYTKTPGAIQKHILPDEHRIIVHQVAPREEVLRHLATMNFVVNFENVGSRQLPSKLIDYGIIQRPVLSVKTGELDQSAVLSFLDGDYTKQLDLGNLDKYRIENVANQFLQLIQS